MATPSERVKAWPASSFEVRILGCAAMLTIHGFVTDAERKKIHERMLKWKRRSVGKTKTA